MKTYPKFCVYKDQIYVYKIVALKGDTAILDIYKNLNDFARGKVFKTIEVENVFGN